MSRPFPADVTVAIVAHNAVCHLPDVVGALRAAGCADARMVVVDVASTDGLRDWVQANAPGADYVRLDRNDGPSPGRNVGIRHASSRYVLLMDADVMIEPDAVQMLHTEMERDSTIAIGSPVVVYEDRPDVIQYAGTDLHYICEAINPYIDRPLASRGGDARDIGVASTCALLLDREKALHIGPFDERYFIGKEDGDFTHRAKLAGYKILELPAARVRHRVKPRSSWLFYYQIRNRWHFLLKNYQVSTLLLILPILLVHEALQAVVLVLKGHGLTYLKAVGGLLAMLPALPADRALTRRIRVRNDGDVLKAGPLVVRSDLSGGSIGSRALTLYQDVLNGYWRLLVRAGLV